MRGKSPSTQPKATTPSVVFTVAVGRDARFEQNSKQMYDKILEGTPWFARKKAQKKLDKAIADVVCDGVLVTEKDMYEVIRRTARKRRLQKSIHILDEHRTSVSAAKSVYVKSVDEKVSLMEEFANENDATVSNGSANKQQQIKQRETRDTQEDVAREDEDMKRDVSRDYNDHDAAPVEECESSRDESPTQPAAMLLFLVAGKEVHFEQNSKQMYDKIMEGPPWFIRKKAQNNLDNAIADVCNGVAVTENDMYEVIRLTTPKRFLQKSIDILDERKTRDEKAAKHGTPTSKKERAVAKVHIVDAGFPAVVTYPNIASSKQNESVNGIPKTEINSTNYGFSVEHSVSNPFTCHDPFLLSLLFFGTAFLLYVSFGFLWHFFPSFISSNIGM